MALKLWLHEHVWCKDAFIKRGKILKDFLDDGLVPFIQSMGYSIGVPSNVLFGNLVYGLYSNRERSAFNSSWNMESYCKNSTAEDRMHFYHVVDHDSWAWFWNQWDHVEDFSEYSFRGMDRRMDVEDYIWRQLDLDNSYQSDVLYGGEEDEYETEIEDNSKKVDIYLIETSGWGGLRR